MAATRARSYVSATDEQGRDEEGAHLDALNCCSSVSGTSHSSHSSRRIRRSRRCCRMIRSNRSYHRWTSSSRIHWSQSSKTHPTSRCCLTRRYHYGHSTGQCRAPGPSCHRPIDGRWSRSCRFLRRSDCRDRCGSASCCPIAATSCQSRCPSCRSCRSPRCVPASCPTSSRRSNCLTSHSCRLC